jgi:hypothetical protein
VSVAAWVQENIATYTGNATAQRDFRVQLRGGRSVLLFSLYLGLLILVGMFVYSQTASLDEISVVEAQDRLRGFYEVIMMLLGATVILVAPALTATTVVLEKQRKSLDLVFSAPVLPKYYLVGKMISSFRYTWMLLVLALPVTATCVVLGGASWSDVLVSYILLSMHALMLTAAALLMSTLAPKPVSAIVWSYSIAIFYLVITSMFGAFAAFGPTGRETPFLSALNPFFVTRVADTYTMIFSAEVPNWILVVVFSVLISKLFILTAGSVLAPFGSKDVPSLRIHMLVYTIALCGYVGYLNASTLTSALGMTFASVGGPGAVLGVVLFALTTPMFIFLPLLTCYGIDSERRFWPNGPVRVASVFDGTPAGALPYIWLVILCAAGALYGGVWISAGTHVSILYTSFIVFTLGFWTMFWGVGRLTSSFLLGLRSARTLQFAIFLVVTILPVPFMSAIQSSYYGYEERAWFWELYLLRPLYIDTDRSFQAFIYGVIMMVIGVILANVAEKRASAKLAKMRTSDGRAYAAA